MYFVVCDKQFVFCLRIVTGTILKESLYSENGSTPTGSRSITHYSNNPDDLRQFDEDSNKNVDHLNDGIASITKTEIIGVSKIIYSDEIVFVNMV